MARFGGGTRISPQEQGERQAVAVMKELQIAVNSVGERVIRSVGTVRNYESGLRQVATFLADRDRNNGQHESLRSITPERATAYLESRAVELSQKSLDMQRQSLQCMMRHVTHRLEPEQRIDVVKSTLEKKLETRAYTHEQIQRIANSMNDKDKLSVQITHVAGLRGHELLTIRPVHEQPADPRPARDEKFSGREGDKYTVIGKGGLCREVLLPRDLADKLEKRRLETPNHVTDRGVYYKTHYDISGGQQLSQRFTEASKQELGFSTGLHGLRHSYAQERMSELQLKGHYRETALVIVSQEMGHFRPGITETYLR